MRARALLLAALGLLLAACGVRVSVDPDGQPTVTRYLGKDALLDQLDAAGLVGPGALFEAIDGMQAEEQTLRLSGPHQDAAGEVVEVRLLLGFHVHEGALAVRIEAVEGLAIAGEALLHLDERLTESFAAAAAAYGTVTQFEHAAFTGETLRLAFTIDNAGFGR